MSKLPTPESPQALRNGILRLSNHSSTIIIDSSTVSSGRSVSRQYAPMGASFFLRTKVSGGRFFPFKLHTSNVLGAILKQSCANRRDHVSLKLVPQWR